MPSQTQSKGKRAREGGVLITPLDRGVYLALAAAFLPAVGTLARAWGATEHQSHGFLVPLVAGWIAWGTRDRALSLLAGSASGQGLALVAALTGAVWWREGRRRLRALAFPIAFLLFMVPIPPDWFTPFAVQLLLFVSWAAEGVLRVLGVEVLRQGNVIHLANGASLMVAEACSGLTAILTLLPIAVLVAYLSPLGSARRVVLVALALPIAMGANLLRVVFTALAAQVWDAETVTGDPWHSLAGLLIYAVACLGLLAAARGLQPRSAAPARR
ncbi:MAG: exosortase/archaeosortase family protein [Proteobacteria bacterium]|nr:exosortase/archaeosortase family protein [Pseudomonadota bacterium]